MSAPTPDSSTQKIPANATSNQQRTQLVELLKQAFGTEHAKGCHSFVLDAVRRVQVAVALPTGRKEWVGFRACLGKTAMASPRLERRSRRQRGEGPATPAPAPRRAPAPCHPAHPWLRA
jgi:hypothetical protein